MLEEFPERFFGCSGTVLSNRKNIHPWIFLLKPLILKYLYTSKYWHFCLYKKRFFFAKRCFSSFYLFSWKGPWQFSVLFIAIISTGLKLVFSSDFTSQWLVYTMDTIRRIIFHHHFRKKPEKSCNLDTYRGKTFQNRVHPYMMSKFRGLNSY